MDLEVTKHKIISSLLWKFMERIGVQGIQFIVTLLLARLLLPEDFGLLVIVMIFITIATVVAQNGFNTALIQKKDADEIDFSSVFYLNFILATIFFQLFAEMISELWVDLKNSNKSVQLIDSSVIA